MLNINAMVTKKALSFDEKEERIKKEKKSPKKKKSIKVPKHFYTVLSDMVKP
jgi:hypothetical protein